MTLDDIFKSYLTDALLVSQGYLQPDSVDHIRVDDDDLVRILQVVRMAIVGVLENAALDQTERKINNYLNA